MGWVTDQIKQRKDHDEQAFRDTFSSFTSAITGKRAGLHIEGTEDFRFAVNEILEYYDFDPCLSLPDNVKTIDEAVEYALQPTGIPHRKAQLTPGWRRWAIGPMIGKLKDSGRAVVLLPNSYRGYKMADIARNGRVNVNRRTEDEIDENVICFYKPLPVKKLSVKDLLSFVWQTTGKADLFLSILMLILITLLSLLIPALTQELFGRVLEANLDPENLHLNFLIGTGAFLITSILASTFITAARNLVNMKTNIKQGTALRSAVMMRILSLPADFFREYGSGDILKRYDYLCTFSETVTDVIFESAVTFLLSVSYFFQIFHYAKPLTVPAVIIIGVTAVFSLMVFFAKKKNREKEMKAETAEFASSYSTITGIQKIKISGSEKRVFARWGRTFTERLKQSYNPPMLVKLEDTVIVAIALIGDLVLYFLAAENRIPVADFYAFTAAYGLATVGFNGLANILNALAELSPAIALGKPIMETVPELKPNAVSVSSLRGKIELDHVSFRYSEDMPLIINDLSLTIKPREYVGIVGTTGCGKSTLIRLILGLEKPEKGNISFDDMNIDTLDVKSLRKHIGSVTQNGKLFHDSIFANITISAPNLSLDEAWEAAEQAGIADHIREMPMGMHTLISEGSGGISGGQRQRLMIARAIAPKPKILIFDEATSALDNISQAKVSEAIDRLNCTRIVIAHRLSTIEHCDRILVMDKGKVVASGTFDQLLETNDFFKELVERQKVD